MPTFANNLLSMGVFCDAGCTVVFTREEVTVTNSAGIKIMQGWRESHGARMWRFNLTTATASNATQLTPMVLPNIIDNDDDDDDDGSKENNIPPTAPTQGPLIASTPPRSMSYQCRAYDLPSVKHSSNIIMLRWAGRLKQVSSQQSSEGTSGPSPDSPSPLQPGIAQQLQRLLSWAT